MTAVAERTEITEPGVYDSLSIEEYHADPVPTGSLSSSGARKLLPPSCPAVFKYERENPPEPTAVFDIGHAAHKLVLGTGPDLIRVDAPDWRTKAAQQQRDEAHAQGAVPLLPDGYQQVHDMADALRAHPIAGALLGDGGIAEASLFWTDEPTGIWRRCRLDWLPTRKTGRMIVPDYKTARSAHPEKFARAALDYGYHQQDAWYRDAVQALGLADDDAAFVFIVQEKTPPYLVSIVELDVVALRIGRRLNRQAIDIYARCERTGYWPGYSDDVELVSLPGWYERQFEEQI